jgi:hypothetical protein
MGGRVWGCDWREMGSRLGGLGGCGCKWKEKRMRVELSEGLAESIVGRFISWE